MSKINVRNEFVNDPPRLKQMYLVQVTKLTNYSKFR